MWIAGQRYRRAEVMRLIGHPSQLGGARPGQWTAGAGSGIQTVEVDTGAGLTFTVLPDRGMDLVHATFRGINLVYHTPTGLVHPAYYDARGAGWQRTFFGGLVTTCGLTHFGAAGPDGDEALGLHGRYSTLPARRWADLSGWEGDEYAIRLVGTMEEAAPTTHKLRLTRTITAWLGENRVQIEDVVENFGAHAAPLTLLYHVNPGFPLLDENAELLIAANSCEPYDETSRPELPRRLRFEPPVDPLSSFDFQYRMQPDAEGFAWVALINPTCSGGLGLYLKFPAAELPCLNEWKHMAPGEYVVGIEPCNTPLAPRARLRERGLLPLLAPGEIRRFHLELGVLASATEIAAMRQRLERQQD